MTTTHLMLTRLGPGAVAGPEGYVALWRRVRVRIDAAIPGVRWPASFAVGGAFDYADVLETPDAESALRVAALIKSLAGAEVELWPAMTWQRFKTVVAPPRRVDEVAEAGDESFPASDPPAFTHTIA